MHSVGAFDAKTHLSQLLQKVEMGDSFRITRRGRVVAILVPPANDSPVDLAIVNIRTNRKKITLGSKLTIKQLKEEGRR